MNIVGKLLAMNFKYCISAFFTVFNDKKNLILKANQIQI